MHAQKEIIEDIAKELNSAQGTWIARSYQNTLRLISQVVFTRSTGFILEFIQNAEDAGQGLSTRGVFQIKLNRQRLKIVHNGNPFNEANVRAICGVQSSKRPEQGTLGYLGIGFKSVFKVTSCPQIYSNGFQFRFDRSHWPNPADSLWRVLPVWVDSSPEPVESDKTTFIIPLEKESFYAHLLEGVKNLGTRLYLFLRWLKRIDIEDEVSGGKWTLENLGEDEQEITTLRRDGEIQRFKFFRATVKVPPYVQEDDLTHEFRANVQEREIAVAFSLDTEGNLCPSEAGAMYGGVYSFLPLGEASSGAKFPIQADFLVQPGRDAINCEVRWNHWLVEEIEKLCRTAIEEFKAHDRWKYQYLPMFATDFSSSDAYTQLFLPKLLKPLAEYLEGHASIPTESRGWAKPSEVVRLTEPEAAAKALTDMGVLEKETIASVLGGAAASVSGVQLDHFQAGHACEQATERRDRPASGALGAGQVQRDAFTMGPEPQLVRARIDEGERVVHGRDVGERTGHCFVAPARQRQHGACPGERLPVGGRQRARALEIAAMGVQRAAAGLSGRGDRIDAEQSA